MSSGKFVRASKFRHVFGEPEKNVFQGTTPFCNGEGEFVCGNKSYIAYPYNGGGGPIQLLHRGQTGRQAKEQLAKQRLTFHKDKILSQAFSPFADNVIATGAGDLSITIHQFADFGPEGPSEDLSKTDKPTATLKKHSKKVVDLAWHPSAANVIASGSHDKTVKVWNVEKQVDTLTCAMSEQIQKIAWNHDGSLMAVTCKKKFAIIDPRTGDAMAEFDAHNGVKPQCPLFSKTHDKIIISGSDNSQTRKIGIWDPKKMSEPVGVVELEQASGQLLPYLDDDLSILFLAGKGDASIKYFELDDVNLYPLSTFAGQESQKGCGWLPKSCCDTTVCEVAIGLRVTSDSIQPVSFRVPRKNADTFQEDIYPDCYAGTSTQSADEYFGGANAAAATRSMDPDNQPADSGRPAATMVVQKSPEELLARVEELEAFIKANGLTPP